MTTKGRCICKARCLLPILMLRFLPWIRSETKGSLMKVQNLASGDVASLFTCWGKFPCFYRRSVIVWFPSLGQDNTDVDWCWTHASDRVQCIYLFLYFCYWTVAGVFVCSSSHVRPGGVFFFTVGLIALIVVIVVSVNKASVACVYCFYCSPHDFEIAVVIVH